MEFRLFSTLDIDECTQLFLKVFTGEPWFDQWQSFEHAKTYLQEFVSAPRFCGYVALAEEKIAGVCLGHLKTWWSGQEYFIDEFYIDHAFQNQGIGSKLLNFAEKSLQSQGVNSFILLTDENLPAEKFYRKNGFEIKTDLVFMVRHREAE